MDPRNLLPHPSLRGVSEGLTTNLLWFLLGLATFALGKALLHILPTKRLWRLSDHTRLTICASTSVRTHTGSYIRAATGVGQLRALSLVLGSLQRAYKSTKAQNILLSEDQIHHLIEHDLILLGGPKNNQLTRRFLDHLAAAHVVDQINDTIYWYSPDGIEQFVPTVSKETVTTDYGLIVRMRNPFSSARATSVLLAGGHTFGTIAAARFFTYHLYKRARLPWPIPENLAALVSCEVIDGYPVAIHLLRKKQFKLP